VALDVSKERIALEMSAPTNSATQRHIPEELNPQKHRLVNPKSSGVKTLTKFKDCKRNSQRNVKVYIKIDKIKVNVYGKN
jgi:hypothetical protein